MTDSIIFKVLEGPDWERALNGAPVKAPIDEVDGYVHFSTRQQVQATLDKWFAGKQAVVLIAFDLRDFGDDLKWEPARGGDLFPHVYADVGAAKAKRVWELACDETGVPQAPDEALNMDFA